MNEDSRVFVDTNVLVYSRDSSEPVKQKQALDWMTFLWDKRNGRISYQVLQEFYVTVTGKLQPGLRVSTAREDVEALLAWNPLPIDRQLIIRAWELQDRNRLSWWDALIVSAAQRTQCQYLLTEDLQEAQNFGGVQVINPFHHSPQLATRLKP
jgi:predicted nucleic acid-binding protein